MILNLNWNRERWRTRDRLIDYHNVSIPPRPFIKKQSSDALTPELNNNTIQINPVVNLER